MKHVLLPLLLLFLLAPPLSAEVRDFVNNTGKTIRGELVSHEGGMITLKLVSGQVFENISPGLFSVDDQLFIKTWMEDTPETAKPVTYNFEIDADRKKTGGGRQDQGYKVVKNEQWAYEITIQNLSRDVVKNLLIKYRVFFSNQADGEFSASESEVTTFDVKEGELHINQPLAFGREAILLTDSVQLDLVDYDYAGERYKDELKGCMLRFLNESGDVVFDWVMPISYLKGKTWETTDPKQKAKGSITIR